jgi:hypothetical protein
LFLLDNARRRLLEFSALGTSGTNAGVVSGELAKRLAMGAPRTIIASGNGFCIQTDENRFTLVGPQGRPKDVVAAPSEHGIISKVYNFTVAGDQVLALVDVQESENQWQRGFVVFPATRPEAFRWLVKGISTEERTFFRLSFPFISTVGKSAYILRMETRPELFRYRKGADTLEPVDAFQGYTETHLLPELPKFRTPEDYEHVMRVVERSTMPVGLYGWEGRAYLLERSWTGTRTDWSLLALDPEAPGSELRSIPIKVNAEHLFAVPGKKHWGLVTKAHPNGLLTQQVTGIRVFPSTALREPTPVPRLCS